MKKVDENERIGFWMGANDIEIEDFFVWIDGSKGKLTIVYICKIFIYFDGS